MRVALSPGRNGLPRVVLQSNDGARAEVYLHGAHVTSWIPAGGDERLFLSEKAEFAPGKAIRGGVPICFPQFSGFGPLPKHGFARNLTWKLAGVRRGTVTSAEFTLRENPESLSVWPHRFQLTYTVAVGGNRLALRLAVANTGAEPFNFSVALHTYLAVEDVGAAAVEGLNGLTYLDTTGTWSERVQDTEPVRFAGEVDRVYYAAAETVRVSGRSGHVIETRKAGFTDVVVWNPGAEKSAALTDLAADDYRRFICVEAVRVGQSVALAPQQEWQGRQTLVA